MTVETKEVIREALKQARKAKGWSQITTAANLGVHVLTYQLWERGAGQPNAQNRGRVKEVLGVDIDEIAKCPVEEGK